VKKSEEQAPREWNTKKDERTPRENSKPLLQRKDTNVVLLRIAQYDPVL
jgi:hypothetical protein